MATTENINLCDLIEHFNSEVKCREYLEELRWPNGVVCPECESESISRIKTRDKFECNECRYQFSVKSGTVMHDSKLPLWKWFLAIYIMGQSKKGVSANQLKRMIGVSYKTAWYLCHRIRSAMASTVENPLSGIVEVDETYIGGKAKGKGRGYTGNKAMVVGAAERGGEIRLKVKSKADKKTLHAFIDRHIADSAEAIHTDEWPAYKGCGDANTRHETVNHSAKEYVRGDIHTNGIENVWSLFKRSIIGSYHHLSSKHLGAYLDEMEWRFNNRENDFIFRDTLTAMMGSEALGYEGLVGRS